MNSLRRLLSSNSLVKGSVLGAARPLAALFSTPVLSSIAALGSLAVVSCSEPDKAPAEAAFSISQSANPSPGAGELPCAATMGRQMFPAQEGQLVLGDTTPDTTTETMNVLINGKDGSRVSCSVHQTGDTTFDVSATIEDGSSGGQFRLTGVSIVDRLSTSAALSWQYQLDGNYTGPCGIRVDSHSDDTAFIEPGSAKLTYECRPFKNADNQTCIATGTILLRNCSE